MEKINNLTQEEINDKVTLYFKRINKRQLANIPQNLHQILDKSWFPHINRKAYSGWDTLISSNLSNLRKNSNLDDLLRSLWNLKDKNGIAGIGEVTIISTAEYLGDLWELERNANCYSLLTSKSKSFCLNSHKEDQDFVRIISEKDDRLKKSTLVKQIQFVNFLLCQL